MYHDDHAGGNDYRQIDRSLHNLNRKECFNDGQGQHAGQERAHRSMCVFRLLQTGLHPFSKDQDADNPAQNTDTHNKHDGTDDGGISRRVKRSDGFIAGSRGYHVGRHQFIRNGAHHG